MKNFTMHIRVDESDKIKAAVVAESVGLDLSAVINMMLKQMIIQKTIPFTIKGDDSRVTEAVASEALEGNIVSDEMIKNLKKIDAGEVTSEEVITSLKEKYGK